MALVRQLLSQSNLSIFVPAVCQGLRTLTARLQHVRLQHAEALVNVQPSCLTAHPERKAYDGFDFAAARPTKADEIPDVPGRIHSVESFSAVDGPGVRFLTFMQGCGYRCVFCSNPDTWHISQGLPVSSKELARKLDRVRPYLIGHEKGRKGGITLSGGEPLLQPEFVAAMCMEAHVRGLTTCIDTTGQGLKRRHWDTVLPHLDYALFCIKSPISEKYEWITKRPMHSALAFAGELEARSIKHWVRYVLIPGLTDGQQDVDALARFCEGRQSMQAVEVLPYHQLGLQKWQELGVPYPLDGQRSPRAEETQAFVDKLRGAGLPVMCNRFS